jgi:hypothetical protein
VKCPRSDCDGTVQKTKSWEANFNYCVECGLAMEK